MFRSTCGDYRVLTTFAHGLRVQRAPGIPRALTRGSPAPLLKARRALGFRAKRLAKLGRIVPRERGRVFERFTHCRHPEVRAVFSAPRRMVFCTAVAAILRGSLRSHLRMTAVRFAG